MTVLNYDQAQMKARGADRPASPLTVEEAVADYIDFLKAGGKATNDTQRRADAHILPKLGDVEVEALTSAQIRRWLSAWGNHLKNKMRTLPQRVN